MGRIRTIKPSFTQDEELSTLPAETHLFAAGLLTYADDEGYFNANPALVKAAVFPLREPSVSTHDMLSELSRIGFIRLGTAADGKRFGQIVKFAEHQRVNRPSASKIKSVEIRWDDSVSPHGFLTEASLQEGNKEGKGRGNGATAPKRSDAFEPAREDLDPLELAMGMIDTLNIPSNNTILRQVAECIQAKARELGSSFAEAHDYIRDKALKAKPPKWLFWFRDAQYNASANGNHGNGAAYKPPDGYVPESEKRRLKLQGGTQ